MGRYILSNKAVEDLSNIWQYTYDTWSETQADKYYFMLLANCQAVADGKIFGKHYAEISNEIFGFKAGQHIIFYRNAAGNTIEVARILHIRMDLKNHLQE